MRVTKESLTARIAELEAGPRSLKEDYYLEVMRELLKYKEGYANLPYVIAAFEDD